MKPFFSVIIPTLNEEKYLPKILTDLVKQKNKDFEVVVIDASSEDKTKMKAEDFKDKLSLRFYTVKKKNVAYSRNVGASKSNGNYLVFLDADTRIRPTFIKLLKKVVDKKKGLLFIPYIIADDVDPQTKIVFSLVNFLIEFSQYLNRPFASGGNIIIEKNLFNRLGGFDSKLFIAEDHNLIQRAYKWGVRARFLHDVVVKFSLRRMRREGQLSIFYKYLVATIHVLVRGDVKKKIFEYQMGGQVDKPLKKELIPNGTIKESLNQVKKFFKKYLS